MVVVYHIEVVVEVVVEVRLLMTAGCLHCCCIQYSVLSEDFKPGAVFIYTRAVFISIGAVFICKRAVFLLIVHS